VGIVEKVFKVTGQRSRSQGVQMCECFNGGGYTFRRYGIETDLLLVDSRTELRPPFTFENTLV